MPDQPQPESQTYRDSLDYLFRTVLASSDADDAIADLDAYRDALAAECRAAAAIRVGALPTANAGRLIAATREQILAAVASAASSVEG